MVCSCAHQLLRSSLQGCSLTIKSFVHTGNRLFVYRAVRFGLCTQLFLFNKICCLFDNKNWENFGNFCIVWIQLIWLFSFGMVHQIFSIKRLKKRNKRKKYSGVNMYTQSKNEESKVWKWFMFELLWYQMRTQVSLNFLAFSNILNHNFMCDDCI
jgi:hypothetical protein